MRHWFKDSHFRSLLKNTGYLAASKGVAAVAGIATIAFAGRALGLEGFGLLILITAYVQAANGLAKFQTWQLVIRYGGAAVHHGDREGFVRAASFGIGLDLVSGLVGMVGAMLLLPLIGGWFGLGEQTRQLTMIYCLLIPTMAASTPTGILRALDRFDLISWQGTITPISRALLAGIAFAADWNLASFVAIWFVTDLVGDLMLWFLAWREARRRSLTDGIKPTLRAGGLADAWPFAIKINLTYTLESAWGPIARLIVGGLLGPASAAAFRVAASLADSARKPADLLAKAYYPQVVRMDAATKAPWKLMLRGTALAGAIGVLAIAILLIGGRPLILALFGRDFLPVYPVLLVMILIPMLAIVSFPLIPMLLALDRPGAPLVARLCGTIIYFAIVAPLCWRYDVQGAAVALVIGHAVMIVVLIGYLWREHRRVRAK